MLFTRQDPAQLAAQMAAMQQSSFNQADPKEWKATLDTAGNGSFVIRFLPRRDAESAPFVHKVTHFFSDEGKKKFYSEACTSTHGDYDSCPVCQYISDNNLYKANNALYGKLKRGHSYWANILVINDPTNAENNGKVFKYRFGKKIMDKINAEIDVDTAIGEIPIDVTCLFGGKNFTLKIKKNGQHSDYGDSKFQGQSELPRAGEAEYQQWLVGEMSDLKVIVDKSEFKDYATNLEQMKKVLGTAAAGGVASEAANQANQLANQLDAFGADMAQFETKPETSTQPETVQQAPVVEQQAPVVEQQAQTTPVGGGADGNVDALLADLGI